MLGVSFAGVEKGTSEWLQAHEALSRLARERAAADAEEGRWLLAALRSAAHVHMGFGSFGEYIERLFGYKPRSTQEKLRVAEALEALPAMARELEGGALSWSAVRELTRVAVAETEREWLGVAYGKTVRQLEELVAGKSPGDDPSSAQRTSARRHVLRFEVAPETFALFREAITQLRRRSNAALDDDSALLSMARHVLGGPHDEGRASYQITLTVCAECGSGHQHASGELVAVGAEVVAMARCDGQHLGHIAMPAANENAGTAGVRTRQRGLADEVLQANGIQTGHLQGDSMQAGGCPVGATVHANAGKTCAHVGARVHATDDKAGHGDDDRATATLVHAKPNTAVSSASAGTSFHAHDHAHPRARAKQTIPPALRRAILLRDQQRCRAPGCKNATFLDLHHIKLRSEGGQNDPDNLVTVCSVHHRAAHRGELVIEMGGDEGIRFSHADGSTYGHVLKPQALSAQAKVFSALRGLGFREGEVRPVLGELQKQGEYLHATSEALLREALRRLTTPRLRHP